MAWKIAHCETEDDGTIHVTKLQWREGKAVESYQLATAVVIPPPGPGHGQAIAALKQLANDLRNPAPPPDVSEIEDALNAGGDG